MKEGHHTGGSCGDWVSTWYGDGNEPGLRLDYPLTPDTIIMDVGAQDGWFTGSLIAKTGVVPHSYLFEPIASMAAATSRRFEGMPTIKVLHVALSDKNGISRMSCSGPDGEASSLHLPLKENAEEVTEFDVVDFIAQEGLTKIDLMQINVEGHEFFILPRLLDAGLISLFTDIQIQFHGFVPQAEERRNEIRRRLTLTHFERYCYPFVWESWRKK